MRFRLGLTTGFAAGYYFGSKAGRERHRQLQAWIQRLTDSEAVETAAEKARAVVDLGVERGRAAVGQIRSKDEDAGPGAHVDLRDTDEGMTIPLVEVSPGANGIGG